MNSQKGFRRARARFQWWAIAAGVVALIVATISTVLCAGSAVTVSDLAAASPVNVKYFVVPRPVKMPAESLYEIAVETLGDGSRYPQIFALNKGRLQPGGGMLENPRVIEPGWILQLPADAVGPGVHFGPLPTVTVSTIGRLATAPRSSAVSPPMPAASPAAMMTGKARSSDWLAVLVLALGVVLFVVMVAALAFSGDRLRTAGRLRPAGRRGGSHAMESTLITSEPWIGSPDLVQPRVESRPPDSDFPSWPGRPGPYALHPDHPSWPGRPDPRWAATEAFLRTSGFPSWPVPEVKAGSAYTRHRPGRHRVPGTAP
jgi:hypothetical protein